jgi:integrase
VPRKRTGTLVPPGADGVWRARVTGPKKRTGGTTSPPRPLHRLGTTDEALAKLQMKKLVDGLEAGADPFEVARAIGSTTTVRAFAEAWNEKRKVRGIGAASDEWRNLELHALAHLGHLPIRDVKTKHVEHVLGHLASKPNVRPKRDGATSTYGRESVRHVRGALLRLFDAAWREELIDANPAAHARMPEIREVRKQRVILHDAEFLKFLSSAEADLELRMASLAARCEGGMRTCELLRWDWAMIDLVDFAECRILRAAKNEQKTSEAQALVIPPVLRPFVRTWWERSGSPATGPVFPARSGENRGRFKSDRGNSYARRLRKALFIAGVWRMLPVEVPATGPGVRTDLGRKAVGTKPAPNPLDPLYFETATTLPVDFHSFRRAFNTALAEAGVNVQTAMSLAAHSDPQTHMRYVMRTRAMRTIPDAALPVLPPELPIESAKRGDRAVESSRPVTIPQVLDQNPEQFQRARQDSNLRHSASKADALSS